MPYWLACILTAIILGGSLLITVAFLYTAYEGSKLKPGRGPSMFNK